MHYYYKTLNGTAKLLDLDCAYDIALGHSSRREGWTATLVFDPGSDSFIELRSSPADLQGQSRQEAEEVCSQYIYENFHLDPILLLAIQQNPQEWKVVQMAAT